MKFKKGDKVKLNPKGLDTWGHQAPKDITGVINSLRPGWWSNFASSRNTITVHWENDAKHNYPEGALTCIGSVEYFHKLKEVTLEEMIEGLK